MTSEPRIQCASQVTSHNKLNLKEACRLLLASLNFRPAPDPAIANSRALVRGAGAQRALPWMLAAHPSHQLWTAGGALWCMGCGAVLRSFRMSPLFRPCTKTLARGFRSRVAYLLEGSLACTGWDEWPDGSPSEPNLARLGRN